MRDAIASVSLSVALLVGCTKPDRQNPADSHPAADSLASMLGVSGTSGNSIEEQMERHLKATRDLTTDSMKALLPRHRELAGTMIAAFEKEMRDMGLAADPAWSATVDSVRADLRALPGLVAADLQVRMPAHDARLVRVIKMHLALMRNRKP